MRIASSVRGSSPAAAMRLKSSRQDRPTSTRIRVRDEERTVLLPLEPLASTVIFTIKMRIPLNGVEDQTVNHIITQLIAGLGDAVMMKHLESEEPNAHRDRCPPIRR